ncbi:MAG TPA: DUF885 family protein [Mycobacteriales bacterium]|nr:DUF885 family protein [Mycobacteriales bacterium]
MNPRIRAWCDLYVPLAREYAGLHDYDGRVQDISDDGVRAGLGALGGDRLDDPHDEAHLAAFETAARVWWGELRAHHRNPLVHVMNLDLACYDRDYAPAAERAEARAAHLAAWPDAVDAAVSTLDSVPAPVAEATLGAVQGLASGVVAERDPVEDAALAAHARLVAHVRQAARDGDPDTALGADALGRLLGSAEAIDVDLTVLAGQADSERDRLRAMLTDACARISPGTPVAEVVAALVGDHPGIDGVLDEARALTEEVIAWTREHDLAPYHDGTCLVGPAPESRRWGMAMMAWAAPGEAAGPSWYHVTPPDPDWPADEQREWLQVFSRTTLPAITVHEVAPGHFSHGIALRHAPSEVRRTLFSESFVEGWAHYVEEVAVEEGFHGDDPRFTAGVAIEALVRVTRLACSIGLHTGAMTVAEATQRFVHDAFLAGPAALAEARRGTFDPTYGRYTWGKLAIRGLREQARDAWGSEFSLPRFHRALLDLGSPPLGLLDTALHRG